jgi:MoaA/NifB/PqqE/SkfB family radical SAM enzyme
VVENVSALADLQKELGVVTPKISLWFTVMKQNVRELPDFIRLAEKVGAAQVSVQRLVHYGQGLAVQEQSLYGELTGLEAEMLGEASRLSQGLGIRLSASGNTTPEASLTPEERERPWAGCQRPWTAKDYPGLILGNAFSQSFAEIWNGERYREFRSRFESHDAPDPCRGCGRLWSI